VNKSVKVIQIGFTYIGTVVGAGFASGQEILQFFTKYGSVGTWTILLSFVLFAWLGTKLMLLSHDVGAKSFEDLNKYMFGERAGMWVSLFTMLILFGVTTVMLAGAGSLFAEQLHWSYQIGLLLTLLLSYLVIANGMDGILAVNTIVVPIMLALTVVVVLHTRNVTDADNWLLLASDAPVHRVWLAPVLYVAYNLAMSQAVLVPLGGSIRDRDVLKWGGIVGGIGIGLMLLAGHYVLSAQMPDIARYEIPMGQIIQQLGSGVKLLFLLTIFGEIFTTFVADVYGLGLQIGQRTKWDERKIVLFLLLSCYGVSQIGFSVLLSVLYPLFGLISMIWFFAMLWRSSPR
jgi:uncharacterized membrane protein YkvI